MPSLDELFSLVDSRLGRGSQPTVVSGAGSVPAEEDFDPLERAFRRYDRFKWGQARDTALGQDPDAPDWLNSTRRFISDAATTPREAGGIVGGMLDAAYGMAAPVARAVGAGETADDFQRQRAILAQQRADRLAQAEMSAPREWLNRNIPGAASSITQMATMAPAGFGGMVAGFAGTTADQAYSEGREAGLGQLDAAGYAARQGVAEAAPMLAFEGLGKFIPGMQGVESRFANALTGASGQAVKQSMRQQAAGALKGLGGELLEENLTSVLQSENTARSILGRESENDYVGPDGSFFTSPMAMTFADTTGQTVLTMGLAETPTMAERARQMFDPAVQRFLKTPSRDNYKALPPEIKQEIVPGSDGTEDPNRATRNEGRKKLEELRKKLEEEAAGAGLDPTEVAAPVEVTPPVVDQPLTQGEASSSAPAEPVGASEPVAVHQTPIQVGDGNEAIRDVNEGRQGSEEAEGRQGRLQGLLENVGIPSVTGSDPSGSQTAIEGSVLPPIVSRQSAMPVAATQDGGLAPSDLAPAVESATAPTPSSFDPSNQAAPVEQPAPASPASPVDAANSALGGMLAQLEAKQAKLLEKRAKRQADDAKLEKLNQPQSPTASVASPAQDPRAQFDSLPDGVKFTINHHIGEIANAAQAAANVAKQGGDRYGWEVAEKSNPKVQDSIRRLGEVAQKIRENTVFDPEQLFAVAGMPDLTEFNRLVGWGKESASKPVVAPAQQLGDFVATETSQEIDDINSGKRLRDRLLSKIDEWVSHGTNGGKRPLDKSWERSAVKRLVEAEFQGLMKPSHGGSLASAKMAVAKATTFEQLKNAIQKIEVASNQETVPSEIPAPAPQFSKGDTVIYRGEPWKIHDTSSPDGLVAITRKQGLKKRQVDRVEPQKLSLPPSETQETSAPATSAESAIEQSVELSPNPAKKKVGKKAPKPKSLISEIQSRGGISKESFGRDYNVKEDALQEGLMAIFTSHKKTNKGKSYRDAGAMPFDVMASSLIESGVIPPAPSGTNNSDWLLSLLKKRAPTNFHVTPEAEYEASYQQHLQELEDAKRAAAELGADPESIRASEESGTQSGVREGTQEGIRAANEAEIDDFIPPEERAGQDRQDATQEGEPASSDDRLEYYRQLGYDLENESEWQRYIDDHGVPPELGQDSMATDEDPFAMDEPFTEPAKTEKTGPAGITKTQAFARASSLKSGGRGLSHDQMVAATWAYLGESPSEWSAVPIKGTVQVPGERGELVSMPEFDMPVDYKAVDTPHESSPMNPACQLCGRGIKTVYHIKNDSKKEVMGVGSECVTNFGDGKSGQQLAKEADYAANRELIDRAHDLLEKLDDQFGSKVGIKQNQLPYIHSTSPYWAMIERMGTDYKSLTDGDRQLMSNKSDHIISVASSLRDILHNSHGAPIVAIKERRNRQLRGGVYRDQATNAVISRVVNQRGDELRAAMRDASVILNEVDPQPAAATKQQEVAVGMKEAVDTVHSAVARMIERRSIARRQGKRSSATVNLEILSKQTGIPEDVLDHTVGLAILGSGFGTLSEQLESARKVVESRLQLYFSEQQPRLENPASGHPTPESSRAVAAPGTIGVDGTQKALFNKEPQGKLFNSEAPKKGRGTESASSPSLLEQIDDEQRARSKASAPIKGQKEFLTEATGDKRKSTTLSKDEWEKYKSEIEPRLQDENGSLSEEWRKLRGQLKKATGPQKKETQDKIAAIDKRQRLIGEQFSQRTGDVGEYVNRRFKVSRNTLNGKEFFLVEGLSLPKELFFDDKDEAIAAQNKLESESRSQYSNAEYEKEFMSLGSLVQEDRASPDLSQSKPEDFSRQSSGFRRADVGQSPKQSEPSPYVNSPVAVPLALPELVELAEATTGSRPQMGHKLRRSLGLFKSMEGTWESKILVRPELAHENGGNGGDQMLRTLSHEIGHSIDFNAKDENPSVPNTMARGNILGRIGSMARYLKHTLTATPTGKDAPQPEPLTNKDRKRFAKLAKVEAGYKATPEEVEAIYKDMLREETERRGLLHVKDVTDELKALTRWWKPFDEDVVEKSYLRYRDSSEELFADAMSVLLNAPAELAERAPIFYHAMEEYLLRKPEVGQELFRLWDLSQQTPDQIAAHRGTRIVEGFQDGADAFKAAWEARHPDVSLKDKLVYALQEGLPSLLVDKYTGLKKRTRKVNDKAGEYLIDELFQKDAPQYQLAMETSNRIAKPLAEAGINDDVIGKYLLAYRIVHEETIPAKLDKDGKEITPTLYGRKDLANPIGMTYEASQEMLDAMKRELGDEKFKLLDSKMREWHREILWPVIEDAFKSGVYAESNRERLEKNKDAYAAFAVVKYVTDNMSPMLRQQVGTFEDVGNPFHFTTLKMLSLIRLNQLNTAKRYVVNELLPQSGEVFHVEVPHGQYHPKGQPRHGYEFFHLLEDGKVTWREVPKFVEHSFANHDTSVLHRMGRALSSATYKVFHPLYVTFSPGFLMANPFRDLMRTYRNLGAKHGVSFRDVFKEWWKAIPEAKRFAVTGFSDSVEKLIEHKAFSISFAELAAAKSEVVPFLPDIKESQSPIEKWIQDGNNPLSKFMRSLKRIGEIQEVATKIAADRLLEKAGVTDSQERAYAVRKYAGTPDWKQAGEITDISNSLFLYSRVKWNALQADADIAFDKQTAAGFWMRQTLISMLPTTLMKAGLYGGLAGLFGDDLEKLLKAIPKYLRDNYLVIPMPWNRGTAEHPKVDFVTIPRDENSQFMARLWGNFLDASAEAAGVETQEASVGSATQSAIRTTSEGFGGAWNPAIQVALAWLTYASGSNPTDSHSQEPIIPKSTYEAGGTEAAKKILQWSWDKTGALSQMTRFASGQIWGSPYEDREEPWFESLAMGAGQMTGLSKLIHTGADRGLQEFDWTQVEREKQRKARERLDHTTPAIRRLNTELAKLSGMGGDLTESQWLRKRTLSLWQSRHYDRVMDEVKHIGAEGSQPLIEKLDLQARSLIDADSQMPDEFLPSILMQATEADDGKNGRDIENARRVAADRGLTKQQAIRMLFAESRRVAQLRENATAKKMNRKPRVMPQPEISDAMAKRIRALKFLN